MLPYQRRTKMDDQSHDKDGREWVKLSNLKGGETVELDHRFTCHSPGKVTVLLDDDGLYFTCDEGQHYLEGQCDDDDHCVGVYPPES
jgi:flavorubredoxin